MKGKTHDLNHDLTFYAHTFNCVCHSIRSMFRVLGIYIFGKRYNPTLLCAFNDFYDRIYLMDKIRPIFTQLTQSVQQKVIYLLLTQNQFDLFHWRNLRDSEKFEKENA